MGKGRFHLRGFLGPGSIIKLVHGEKVIKKNIGYYLLKIFGIARLKKVGWNSLLPLQYRVKFFVVFQSFQNSKRSTAQMSSV